MEMNKIAVKVLFAVGKGSDIELVAGFVGGAVVGSRALDQVMNLDFDIDLVTGPKKVIRLWRGRHTIRGVLQHGGVAILHGEPAVKGVHNGTSFEPKRLSSLPSLC